MKKYIVTSSILLILVVIILVLFLSQSKNDKPDLTKPKNVLPAIVNQATEPGSEILETDQSTVCGSDNDCWCRSFDGTGFQPGKAPSICDLQTKRCVQCYYE